MEESLAKTLSVTGLARKSIVLGFYLFIDLFYVDLYIFLDLWV